MPDRYIGLMSGTSLDGVDGVLVDLQPGRSRLLTIEAHAHQPFEPDLAAELLALNTPGADELHRAALAGNGVAKASAGVVRALLEAADASPLEISAIGFHGQTVRHRPGSVDGIGYTWQLGNASLLAELTGIDVVSDFRSRDVAAGGQGAPLVPAFHRSLFGAAAVDRVVLNLGGIANLTLLHRSGATGGFDCGPGNALLDLWCRRHLGLAFDDGGRWGAAGQVDRGLLARLLAEPYFAAEPPKSTGRDLFHAEWLGQALAASAGEPVSPQDVQATLAELSAAAIAAAIRQHAPETTELIVCGGGARNADLQSRIAGRLPEVAISTSDAHGLGVDQVEACAFAWLARQHVRGESGNLPAVTGAVAPRVLGARYPR